MASPIYDGGDNVPPVLPQGNDDPLSKSIAVGKKRPAEDGWESESELESESESEISSSDENRPREDREDDDDAAEQKEEQVQEEEQQQHSEEKEENEHYQKADLNENGMNRTYQELAPKGKSIAEVHHGDKNASSEDDLIEINAVGGGGEAINAKRSTVDQLLSGNNTLLDDTLFSGLRWDEKLRRDTDTGRLCLEVNSETFRTIANYLGEGVDHLVAEYVKDRQGYQKEESKAQEENQQQEEKQESEAPHRNNQPATLPESSAPDSKIEEFLQSRTVGAKYNRRSQISQESHSLTLAHCPLVPPPAIPPPFSQTKKCDGPCGMFKAKECFTLSQWNKPLHTDQFRKLFPYAAKERFCILCRLKKRKKSDVTINEEDDIIATPIPRETVVEPDDEFLPAKLKKTKQCDTPYGRIRACMCQRPRVCRDLMWRWARLKEAKYINYFQLPQSFKGEETPLGKHISAFREGVRRHLYDAVEGETATIQRTIVCGSKGVTTSKTPKTQRVSFVHFHPDLIPYMLEENGSRGHKLNKWRLSAVDGKMIGLTDRDKCPVPDLNGDTTSYYALPTYSLEQATADVERAEKEYKQKSKQFVEDNERITREMATDPCKYALEIHDLKERNVNLTDELKELKDKVRKQIMRENAEERETERMQKALEKTARRLDKWESSKKKKGVGRTTTTTSQSSSANQIYKEFTGQDLAQRGYFDVEPTGTGGQQRNPRRSGGKRWSDPRMDRAVDARWADPALSIEEALRIGGFEFPLLSDPDRKGVTQKDLIDGDGVSVTQRKNNLLRRLRQRKRMVSEGTWPNGNDNSAMMMKRKSTVGIETAKGADDL
eukprot:CAMPEP_0201623924 /NCGR_PEP_ID=MMETSP0493-20130528/276_1 /ASSEMBLY_ACC=CAM_ASM_000838 /TAXON_ID=420259 /ORGANISM="Thalassiosira gravida, Strain GMp14c1" /LENGTH=832 /DNA_ID=CAMNT_0048093653 /DNA_START=129 /DNA_END=2627 /DNA_ORIENTATION=-